jgi:hypothetical protein
LGFQKTAKGEERENCSPKISMCSNWLWMCVLNVFIYETNHA